MSRLRGRRWFRPGEDEIDPMAGAANLVDAILVFACGLIVVIIVSWNLQGVVFSDMTEEERSEVVRAISQVTRIKQGQEIDEMPRLAQGEGEGYREMGTVYMDPETGNLIMVTNEEKSAEDGRKAPLRP